MFKNYRVDYVFSKNENSLNQTLNSYNKPFFFNKLFLKKPTISIGHSLENVRGSKIIAQKTSMVRDLGFYQSIDISALKSAIDDFQEACFESYSLKIDGFGAERISEVILQND